MPADFDINESSVLKMKNKENKHSAIEDMFALLTASSLISLGVFFLQQANLLSGGTAGLALILAQTTDLSFGKIFFILNLPFYYVAWRHIGLRFTINTMLSVTVISMCTELLPLVLKVEAILPVYAAVIAGLLTGVGMLVMFRHNSSLGGVSILALYLQKVFSISAGKVMLAIDVMILLVALFVLPLILVVLSVIAAVCISLVLTFNHKPFRYQLR